MIRGSTTVGIASQLSVPMKVLQMLFLRINGELHPKFDPFGNLIDPYGDPNFYGINGSNNPKTATHGINSSTHLIQTNQ